MILMYEIMLTSDQNINLILQSDTIQKDSCQRIGSVFLSVQPSSQKSWYCRTNVYIASE